MVWNWTVKPRQSVDVGGEKGTVQEAGSWGAWPNYQAAYLAKRLGAKRPEAAYDDRYRLSDNFGADRFDFEDEITKLTYLDKVASDYKVEADECLKREFVDWLQGKHEDNDKKALYPSGANLGGRAPRRAIKREYEGSLKLQRDVGSELTQWRPTWWGKNQLTHLPGVRQFLRDQHIRAEEHEFALNVLAEFGPQNLDQAWTYFKHWVKGRPVKPEECVHESGSINATKRSGPISMHDTGRNMTVKDVDEAMDDFDTSVADMASSAADVESAAAAESGDLVAALTTPLPAGAPSDTDSERTMRPTERAIQEFKTAAASAAAASADAGEALTASRDAVRARSSNGSDDTPRSPTKRIILGYGTPGENVANAIGAVSDTRLAAVADERAAVENALTVIAAKEIEDDYKARFGEDSAEFAWVEEKGDTSFDRAAASSEEGNKVARRTMMSGAQKAQFTRSVANIINRFGSDTGITLDPKNILEFMPGVSEEVAEAVNAAQSSGDKGFRLGLGYGDDASLSDKAKGKRRAS